MYPIHLPACARAGLLALAAWSLPVAAKAMQADQMRAIAGLAMLDARATEVVDAYGQPSALCADGVRDCIAGAALPAGDWELVYLPKARATARSESGMDDGFALPIFSRVVLHAKGGVGRVVTEDHPRRLRFEVPGDPWLAHQIVSVTAQLRTPVALADLVARFGHAHQRVTGPDGARWLRYWVVRKQGQLPLRLYAVELRLDAGGDKVTALRADGSQVGFVASELKARHDIWERNLYD